MMISRIFNAPRTRSTPRKTFCPESLEGRNLLSAAVASPAPPPAQVALNTTPMLGEAVGIATLGTTTFDSSLDAIVPVSYKGIGVVTGLGAVVVEGSHTTEVLASTGYSTSLIVGGKATIIGTNGNSISLIYTGSGTLVPGETNLFNDTFNYTITGGTGQFVGATGSGVIHSTDEPGGTATEVPFIFNLDGVVSTAKRKSS